MCSRIAGYSDYFQYNRLHKLNRNMSPEEDDDEWIDLYADTERNRVKSNSKANYGFDEDCDQRRHYSSAPVRRKKERNAVASNEIKLWKASKHMSSGLEKHEGTKATKEKNCIKRRASYDPGATNATGDASRQRLRWEGKKTEEKKKMKEKSKNQVLENSTRRYLVGLFTDPSKSVSRRESV